MRDCCVAYVRQLDFLAAEWTDEARRWRDGTHPLLERRFAAITAGEYALTPAEEAAIYDKCVADNVPLRASIIAGTFTDSLGATCCPWDDRLDHGPFMASYQALCGFSEQGGDVRDLTFGPIEVIPDGPGGIAPGAS